jgi:hypothetical protein
MPNRPSRMRPSESHTATRIASEPAQARGGQRALIQGPGVERMPLKVRRARARGEQLHAPLRLPGGPADQHPAAAVGSYACIERATRANAHAGRIDALRGGEGATLIARDAQEHGPMGLVVASNGRGWQRGMPSDPHHALAIGGHRGSAVQMTGLATEGALRFEPFARGLRPGIQEGAEPEAVGGTPEDPFHTTWRIPEAPRAIRGPRTDPSATAAPGFRIDRLRPRPGTPTRTPGRKPDIRSLGVTPQIDQTHPPLSIHHCIGLEASVRDPFRADIHRRQRRRSRHGREQQAEPRLNACVPTPREPDHGADQRSMDPRCRYGISETSTGRPRLRATSSRRVAGLRRSGTVQN